MEWHLVYREEEVVGVSPNHVHRQDYSGFLLGAGLPLIGP
jgi:hypothetical protein